MISYFGYLAKNDINQCPNDRLPPIADLRNLTPIVTLNLFQGPFLPTNLRFRRRDGC